MENGYIPEGEQNEKKVRAGWIIMATVMGILGVIVFLVTQDMTQLMVLVDSWTIVNAVLFVFAVVAYRFAFKRKKSDEYDDDIDYIAGEAS